jgi:hypothetical protein
MFQMNADGVLWWTDAYDDGLPVPESMNHGKAQDNHENRTAHAAQLPRSIRAPPRPPKARAKPQTRYLMPAKGGTYVRARNGSLREVTDANELAKLTGRPADEPGAARAQERRSTGHARARSDRRRPAQH